MQAQHGVDATLDRDAAYDLLSDLEFSDLISELEAIPVVNYYQSRSTVLHFFLGI